MKNKKKQYEHALLIEDRARSMMLLAYEDPPSLKARDQMKIIIQAAVALQMEFS